MRLKKLTISGFKSFADKVAIDFDCEVIGIVGPNGCGKSNIVDAFRWVMGEQSARSLRGDKMLDVLFAGADSRKSQNYAEVSVTLADIQDELPVPYEELTITRRLWREGESEYFINKEPARLKDIQGLLLGSGMGKNAFSIFEQGKLDQIIHLNPTERRAIFDEAAGTSRFLVRKKETLKKLGGVSENFSRVKDVHAEIEKQTKQLKKQASHAKSYQDNKIRLEELEKAILIFRWKNLSTKTSDLEAKLKSLQSALDESSSAIGLLESELEEKRNRLHAEEVLARQHQNALHTLNTKIRILDAEIAQQKNHLLESKNREQRIKAELQDMAAEGARLLEEERIKEQTLAAILEEKGRIEKELASKKEALYVQELEIKKLREDIKQTQSSHLDQVKREKELNAALQAKILRYERESARLANLLDLEKKHLKAIEESEAKSGIHQKHLLFLAEEVDGLKIKSSTCEKEWQSLRKQIQECQVQEQKLLRTISESEGHQKILKRLQEELEGFSAGAKAILKEIKSQKSTLKIKIEPLFSYFTPKRGYESILASSMRPYADTLVVEGEEEFAELLDFAKRKKVTDFSVLIKSRLEKNLKAKEGTLAGHLEGNLVALHFSKGCTLAAEGHFFDSLGVFFHTSEGHKSSNAFLREAELNALLEQIERLHEEQREKAGQLQELTRQLQVCEKGRSEVAEVFRKKEMDLVQENFLLQQSLAQVEKIKNELSALNKEKSGLSSLENGQADIEALKSQNALLEKESEKLLANLKQQEGVLEEKQVLASQALAQMKEVEGRFYRQKEQAQKTAQEIAILKAKEQQRAAQQKKREQEIVDLRASVESALKAIVAKEKEVEAETHALKANEVQRKTYDAELLELKKGCDLLEKELMQKRKTLSLVEKERHGFEVILAKDLAERVAAEEELKERHRCIPQESAWNELLGDSFNVEEATQEVQQLRAAVLSAGAVNMTAIEEFQECQARFEFLDQQLKDLEESKKDLEEIIAKLDQESRKVFKKTFLQIRDNFQKNFAILFNGGSADLTFTESSDILEAGIEIVAKPPGKQMRSISLLSGGEKCLTALALLFSIFEVRPAPFCILDEVDAPLDDTNIDRFTQMLKQFIDKTQFIIVTHNKKTMAIADLLIGVSMEEKGVSKLISLSFEKFGQRQPA